MDKKEIMINISEVTVIGGRRKNIRIKVDGKIVQIPVDESVYAYFKDQFLRTNPTPMQKQRFATIMNVLRSAYLKGVADGEK